MTYILPKKIVLTMATSKDERGMGNTKTWDCGVRTLVHDKACGPS